MNTITIYREIDSLEIHNVDEYYCTNQMFYIHTKSGDAYYYPLDKIDHIHVEEESEDKE